MHCAGSNSFRDLRDSRPAASPLSTVQHTVLARKIKETLSTFLIDHADAYRLPAKRYT